jgi:hypothetical protein
LLLALAVAGLGLTLPAALDFGVRTGSAPPYVARVVAVQNATPDPIWIARVALAREPSSDFRVVADSCSTRTLAPGAACAVTVEFAPAFRSSSGQIDDQLLFWGDGATYQAVRLRGVYDRGQPAGNGPPAAFGLLLVGGLLLAYVVIAVIVATAAMVGIVIVVNVARRARN